MPAVTPTMLSYLPMDKYRGAVVEVPVGFQRVDEKLNISLHRTYSYRPLSHFHRMNPSLARLSLHMTVTSLISRNSLYHLVTLN